MKTNHWQQYTFFFLLTVAFVGAYHQPEDTDFVELYRHEKPAASWRDSIYLNTTFLKNHKKVNRTLQKDGFSEGFFKSSDGLSLCYLLLEKPLARVNVIICCGWLPGRKEGMASLYALLPDDCNILFFDARGHGSSEGPLFSQFYTYGKDEYKDILGAISFMHTRQPEIPIIVFGMCAGAFNAAHALIHLSKQPEMMKKYGIAGFIFDSGWGSVTTSSYTAPYTTIKDSVHTLLAGHRNKQTLLSKCIAAPLLALYTLLHKTTIAPLLSYNESQSQLYDKIHMIPVPTLFIHAYDDSHVPIQDAQRLAQSCRNAHCWWIDRPSKHGCHHLKHAAQYRQKLHKFIEDALFEA